MSQADKRPDSVTFDIFGVRVGTGQVIDRSELSTQLLIQYQRES